MFRQFRSLVRLSFLELIRRHEIFVFLLLALALLVPLAGASPFGDNGASRYLDELALLLLWAFSAFIALGMGSRLFPPEFESRTIYPLLAKPISRSRLLLGKYLGATLATATAVTFFYLLYLVVAWSRGGSVSMELLQGYVLHLIGCALAVALVLFASLIVSRGAALVFSGIVLVGMFFFGRRLLVYAEGLSSPVAWFVRTVYALGPHVEFFDMRQRIVHGWGAVDGAVFAAVIGYGLIYIALLLSASAFQLGRKKL